MVTRKTKPKTPAKRVSIRKKLQTNQSQSNELTKDESQSPDPINFVKIESFMQDGGDLGDSLPDAEERLQLLTETQSEDAILELDADADTNTQDPLWETTKKTKNNSQICFLSVSCDFL